ncbi:hypothetical protein GCM10011588_62740 [Nocardia jinanensis]|uniref:Uncharacterized protein n=1 Tax=Nocardia jinanensis TaxID=382504 RepID=A0A917RWB7_9NOCA|nr:hypothetical protein GCM10011588_62740 [Nocardia jinanensis]
MRREFGDGRFAEQVAHRNITAGQFADPHGGARRGERITAEVEESIEYAYSLDTEDIAEDIGDHLLDHRARRDVGGCRIEHRLGQRSVVDLAVDGQRQFGQHDDARGHHVFRQHFGHMSAQCVGAAVRIPGRHHIGDQTGGLGTGPMHDHDRRRHRIVGQQGVADLVELDPEPAQLDLLIGAAPVFQFAPVIPPRDISTAIQPGPRRTERVGDETRRAQRPAAEVSAGQLCARDIDLAPGAQRCRSQPLVQHVGPQTRQRRSDRTRRARHSVLRGQRQVGHEHRGLGDPVAVGQYGNSRIVFVPGGQARRVEAFPGQDHRPQRRRPLGLAVRSVSLPRGRELLESRRGLVEDGHLLTRHQPYDIIG